MKFCGWKTPAIFDRYNIIDEQDLARAVAKRFVPTLSWCSTTRDRGGTGRRAGLRILWGNLWGFESLRSHQGKKNSPMSAAATPAPG